MAIRSTIPGETPELAEIRSTIIENKAVNEITERDERQAVEEWFALPRKDRRIGWSVNVRRPAVFNPREPAWWEAGLGYAEWSRRQMQQNFVVVTITPEILSKPWVREYVRP